MGFFEKDQEGINASFYKNDFEGWDKNAEISYANNEIRQKERHRFFQMAYDYLSANHINGDYYEFGCHRVRTFKMSLSEAKRRNLTDMNFFAFDSFNGLPECGEIDKFPGFDKGALRTSEDEFDAIIKKHGLYLDRIVKIKGYYKDSLTDKLQKELSGKKSKIALVYIDCDLYESALSALTFIDPLLQKGAVLCLDDWNLYGADPGKGERRALKEFSRKTSWKFEEFLPIGWFGKSFIVV